MHEIVVILQRDLRRLWWQIGVAAAMSATHGCLDALRAGVSPGGVEVSLDILLPLVWACLIAQAIHQEALVGDREFWMTRPYRWPRLLAAKALFAALCVHLPSFLTDAAILLARGFNPLTALPQLLGKQLMLAGVLTLPAMALATVLSDLTQFAVAVPILFLAMDLSVKGRPRFPSVYIAVAFLAVAAVAVAVLQYRQRRTGLARILAISGGLAAGALAALTTFAPLPAAAPGVAAIGPTLRLAADRRIYPACVNGGGVYVEIPVVAAGFPKADYSKVGSLSVELTGAKGVRFAPGRAPGMFAGWESGPDGAPVALTVSLPRAAYDLLASGKVAAAGKLDLQIFRAPPVRLRVGESRQAPGIGRCSSQIQGNHLIGICESVSGRPMQARIAYEFARPHGFGTRDQILEAEYPNQSSTLLSPLHRIAAQFWIENPRLGDQAVILVQRISGHATVNIDLEDIQLPGAGHCAEKGSDAFSTPATR